MHDRRTWIVVTAALAVGSAVTLMVERVRAKGIPEAGALTYTGELETPDGTPVSGEKNIGLVLYDAAKQGAEVCSVGSGPVTLVSGRFQLSLPKACSDAISGNPDLWSELQVEGAPMGRTKLGAVPYAIESLHAVTAANTPVITAWALVPNPKLRQEISAAGTNLSGHTTKQMWRRVGDSIEISIGTDLNAAQSNNPFVWDLPPGVVVDESKLEASKHVGSAFLWVPTFGQQACVSLLGDGGRGIQVRCNGLQSPVGGEYPYALPPSTFINIHIVIPVKGWSTTE